MLFFERKRGFFEMACPAIPQPKNCYYDRIPYFCVQSPGFFKPLTAEQVQVEFSKAMCAHTSTESKYGDVEKVAQGSVIHGEVSDDPMVVNKDSIFWQSQTAFFDPDTLVQFACGLAQRMCDRQTSRVTVVFMPYYTDAPLSYRALTLSYVFGLLITPS